MFNFKTAAPTSSSIWPASSFTELLKKLSHNQTFRGHFGPSLQPPGPLSPSHRRPPHGLSSNKSSWLLLWRAPRISSLLPSTAAMLFSHWSRAWKLAIAPEAHLWLRCQRVCLTSRSSHPSAQNLPMQSKEQGADHGSAGHMIHGLLPPSPSRHIPAYFFTMPRPRLLFPWHAFTLGPLIQKAHLCTKVSAQMVLTRPFLGPLRKIAPHPAYSPSSLPTLFSSAHICATTWRILIYRWSLLLKHKPCEQGPFVLDVAPSTWHTVST